MKKALSILLAAMMVLSLAACGEKKTEPTPADPPAPTTPVESETSSAPEHDSKEGIQAQIAMMAENYEELVAQQDYEPSTVFVTDMDADGYLELILMEPNFVMYEVTEDNELMMMAQIEPNSYLLPYLMTDQPYLTILDNDGLYHHIFQTDCFDFFGDEPEDSNGTNVVSQIDYTLEPDGFYFFDICGVGTTYGEDGEVLGVSYEVYDEYTEDTYEVYSAMLDYLSELHGEMYVMTTGGVFTSELEGLGTEGLTNALTDAWERFDMKPWEPDFTYADLEGTWVMTGGEVEGSEFDASEDGDMTYLTFSDEVVTFEQYGPNGEMWEGEEMPWMLKFVYAYGNDLWCADIADGNLLRYATATICEDSRLCLTAQLIYSEDDYASVVWYFEKEDGWG